MSLKKCYRAICVGLVWLAFALAVRAQAPLTVEGIADRAYGAYTDRVSFRVPSTNGYTYYVLLDAARVPTDVWIEVSSVDYHELYVWRTNQTALSVTNRRVQFIVRSSERNAAGSTEDGIPPWTPYPTINSAASEFVGAHLRLIAPQDFPTGYPIPVVAWVENDQGHAVRVNGVVGAAGHPSFQVKRGVGSGFLGATNPAGALVYPAQIGGLTTNKTINLESSTTWMTVSGTLGMSTTWPENSRIHVSGALTVPSGGVLTIGAGTIVRVNASTDITNLGQILINGTTDRPVVFMPASPGQPWGGFIQHANNTAFNATGAIFTGSGAQPCWYAGHGCSSSVSGIGSHRGEQALIALRGANCNLTLTDCAAIYLAGQLSHSVGGSGNSYAITLKHFLLQRCTTGGEYTDALFTVNESAFIECREDLTTGESPEFFDGDNDGLYIVNAPAGQSHTFTNSLFGWTQDDGIDSGGSGAGRLTFQDCWFESIFHEGNSLSGTGKDDRHYGTVFINCGQGIEAGYDAPTGRVERCLILGNIIGARFGDNYAPPSYTYGGSMRATNSILIHNYRDVWGMNWQDWAYRVSAMDIQNSLFGVPNTNHPNNSVWNPTADAGRLAAFMTTPPDAAVGIGLAVWSNQFPMAAIFQGVPVRLSSFTTNSVSVNYTVFDSGDDPLGGGTLAFAPGETVKRIYPAGFNLVGQSMVRVTLSGSVRAELTGAADVIFQGSVPAPQVSLWVVTNLFQGARIVEGTFVTLNTPSAQTVSVNYQYESSGTTLSSGTLSFSPLETSKQLFLTGVNPFDYSLIRLSLSNPVGAALAGITSVSFTNPPLIVAFAVASNQLNLATFSNGVPVSLNLPASIPVSVDFQYESSDGVLTNGTLFFTPGQGAKQLTAPTINPQAYNLIRVGLGNAVGAQLGSPSNVYFIPVVAAPSPLLVTSNSMWRYLDTGGDAGTAWRQLSFNDDGWSNGVAQLGFSNGEENDEATLIRRVGTNGQVTIAFYFRQKFVVPNPGLFTNLFLWLLRDDGGVVYLNNTEVYRSPSMPLGTVTYQTLANAQGASAPPDNTVDTTNVSPSRLVTGTNIVAVEIHQHDTGSSDISFNFALTGQPPPALPPQQVYWANLGGQLVLAWSAAGYELQEADDLNIPIQWRTAASTSPLVVNLNSAPRQKFYRLHKL